MLEGGPKSSSPTGINGADCTLTVNEIVVKSNAIRGKMIYFSIFTSLSLKSPKPSTRYTFKSFFSVRAFEELGIMFWEFV